MSFPIVAYHYDPFKLGAWRGCRGVFLTPDLGSAFKGVQNRREEHQAQVDNVPVIILFAEIADDVANHCVQVLGSSSVWPTDPDVKILIFSDRCSRHTRAGECLHQHVMGVTAELLHQGLPMYIPFSQQLIPDIYRCMAPGALGEQFNHPADLRVALDQNDIPLADDAVEIVHVVYHGLLIFFAGCLKASENTITQVSNKSLYSFHGALVLGTHPDPRILLKAINLGFISEA
jgi:hypothetical protein